MAAEHTWKRSTYTKDGSPDCVECASDGRVVWIRDSKDRDGERLEVPWFGWRAFLGFVRS
ncbi:DUF397 domain-containing protein [Lentzea albida]|uniref:DUF397 domain-containing protein n=1 Tax=Lentzea albida TaxID=65499 RepID=A0A1H9VTJ8_9PSEU|nr:protein of unknown function [Lentzea albida]